MTITGKAIKTNKFAYVAKNLLSCDDFIRRRIYQIGDRYVVRMNSSWQDLSWLKISPLYTVYVDIC